MNLVCFQSPKHNLPSPQSGGDVYRHGAERTASLQEKRNVPFVDQGFAQKVGNPTHGSGWIVQVRPIKVDAVGNANPTNGSWLDGSSPAY